jgi:aspartokinase/homoserine dehydrogenase 1
MSVVNSAPHKGGDALSFAARAMRAMGIDIAVIGASGRVGSRLLELIAAQRTTWAARGIEPRVVAVANSRQALAVAGGIDAESAVAALRATPLGGAGFAQLVERLPSPPAVILDCTASAEIAAHYPHWLAQGIDIVTPNKHGPAADRALEHAIVAAQAGSGAHLYDATTVGAQLPLLAALRELAAAGDRVENVEAVLSGTLSYVLGRVQQGEPLSAAVRAAVAEGYAEPHPAADLSGADAARKLVILLRALGYDIELADVDLVPLVDAELLAEPDASQFLQSLSVADETWRARAAIAQARGERWVYRASFADGKARLAPERVAPDHPLAQLAPCENKFVLRSAFYRAAPLSVSGPGAGIDLTAAGVLGDLQLALQRHAAPRTRIAVAA